MSQTKSPAPTGIGNGAAVFGCEEQPDTTATSNAPQVTLEEARRVACLCNSYTRLPTIIGLWHRMEREEWLQLLGEWWSFCGNVSAHLSWLRVFLPRTGPARPMMTPDEQAAWDALPDRVRVYRGARVWKLGASWSLDRSVAEKFPRLLRYSFGPEPILLTAEVRKRDILALKLDRDEAEAIVLRGRRILSREPIAQVEAAA